MQSIWFKIRLLIINVLFISSFSFCFLWSGGLADGLCMHRGLRLLTSIGLFAIMSGSYYDRTYWTEELRVLLYLGLPQGELLVPWRGRENVPGSCGVMSEVVWWQLQLHKITFQCWILWIVRTIYQNKTKNQTLALTIQEKITVCLQFYFRG